MIFGVYELDGKIYDGFYDWETWYKETFCPDTNVLLIIDLTVHGKTYEERKNDVVEKAIDFQDLGSVYDIQLYWSELAEFGAYFEKQGKRYGLLNEFRENGIL